MSYHFSYGWVSGREDYVLSEITVNVPVDSARFGEPLHAIDDEDTRPRGCCRNAITIDGPACPLRNDCGTLARLAMPAA
jgi:hypothetical protein